MRCPICKKPVEASPDNRFRPFCSERCRMIDLGTWAGEGYRVEGGKVPDREHPQDRAYPVKKHED
ncbi:MAG: DNA gyrase inhibitor YacG [Candidatus Binataceae bacterium]